MLFTGSQRLPEFIVLQETDKFPLSLLFLTVFSPYTIPKVFVNDQGFIWTTILRFQCLTIFLTSSPFVKKVYNTFTDG